jgi:hypothetical protein
MSSAASLPIEITLAAERGELQKVVKWLRKGGSVGAICSTPALDGRISTFTLLHVAAADDHLAIVKELVKRGASVDLQSSLGLTALVEAACRGHLSIVLVLLQQSANPNLQDIDGITALMAAADQGHEACVKALLRAKANTELLNKAGDTALRCAENQGHTPPSRSSSNSTPRRRSQPPPRLQPHRPLASPR